MECFFYGRKGEVKMSEPTKAYRLYILFKDRTPLNMDIIGVIQDRICKEAELEDYGFGSAYNMPAYLLGEIADYPDKAVVAAVDWDEDGRFHPRILADADEINMLIEALDEHQEQDAWEIVVDINKALRGK